VLHVGLKVTLEQRWGPIFPEHSQTTTVSAGPSRCRNVAYARA